MSDLLFRESGTQLEELDQAAQRSVAAEVESALEGRLGEAACLVDEAGRARILEICEKVRRSCARLDDADSGARHTAAKAPKTLAL